MSDAPPRPQEERKELSRSSLGWELGVVFAIQLALVAGLVQVDRVRSLGGNLHALVGGIFVFLPMFVLDRRDRPYARYGVVLGKPRDWLGDLGAALGASFLFFPLTVAGTYLAFAVLGPWIWGLREAAFSFAWPQGYPVGALAHLIVVAFPEEFFYRAYVMGRLDDIFEGRVRLLGAKVGWSLPIQAALFAVGHFAVGLHPGTLMVFFPALVFGWLRARTGTILAPIFFHAASNIFMDIFRAGFGLR